jgi:hypothetical protein
MVAREVAELIRSLQRGIGQAEVALRCECNLETVYVSASESGGVRVSDRGESFAYLAHGTDSTFRPVEDLNPAAAAEVCRQSGVVLWSDDPEAFSRIECEVDAEASVAEAISRVATAIDGVFNLALRDNLR